MARRKHRNGARSRTINVRADELERVEGLGSGATGDWGNPAANANPYFSTEFANPNAYTDASTNPTDTSWVPWYAAGSPYAYDILTRPASEGGSVMSTVESAKETISAGITVVEETLQSVAKWAFVGLIVYLMLSGKHKEWE